MSGNTAGNNGGLWKTETVEEAETGNRHGQGKVEKDVQAQQNRNDSPGMNSGTPSNNNNSMLNFNDDYATILNNLTNGHTNALGNEHNDNAARNQQSNAQTGNERSNGMDKGTLDLLLQHYQELLNRSNSGANSPQYGNSSTNNGKDQASVVNRSPSPNLNEKTRTTEKPCDHCRRRQTKCVLVPDLPNCVQCETKGIKCTFSELPSSKAAASVLQEQRNKRDRVDENINVHELLKRTKMNNGTGTSGSARVTNDNGSNLPNQYYNDVLQSWYKSQVSPESPQLPFQKSISDFNNGQKTSTPSAYDFNQFSYGSNSAQSPPMTNGSQNVHRQMQYNQPPIQYPRSSYFVGPTSVFDINLINHMKLDKIDQVQLSKTLALRKVSPTAQFILRDDFNQQLYLKQEREIDLVEKLVHPHGKILVDIFFKLIHPYFPILHERVFLEKYSRSYRELTAPILASIYSLALQWWDFHPQLIGFPKPDVVEQLNEIALRTFYEVFERPKLSIVQTGLLILHCRSECPNNWVLCSEVVALAEDLGLGVDCQDWRLPRWERGLRRRLAWAVWCQDKWTSLLESRHSHLILGRNWMVKLLTEEDFPDKSPVISSSQRNNQQGNRPMSPIGNSSLLDISPTDEDFNNGKLLFRQMVSLSIILGEIMDTFYTLGAIKTTTKIEHVLKLAKPLQLKLREWYHSLPHQLSMNNYHPGSYNSNATLTLAYFAAEITLHRKIISTLATDAPAELVPVCRTAAKTRLIAAIEFIRDLKTEHINSFWYTCSTGNLALIGTFSALLYVTAPTKDEGIVFRDCLRNYIWILRMSSKSFERAANALNRIHMLLTQIPGLLTDEPNKQPFVPPKSQSPFNPASGFNQQQQPPQSQNPQSQPPFPNTQGQIPYYNSPHLNNNSSTNAAFEQLKNLPPEILQSLTSLQSNMPNLSSGSFTELNELLETHSKNSKENDNAKSSKGTPSTKDKSPQRHDVAIDESLNAVSKPITPASTVGNPNLNPSPQNDMKESPAKKDSNQYPEISPSSLNNSKTTGNNSAHEDELKKINDGNKVEHAGDF